MGLNTRIINSAVIAIVVIVVLFTLYSVLVPEAQTAGSSMNDSSRCEAVGCDYNQSGRPAGDGITCYNTTSTISNASCPNAANSIPLGGLFNASGIVFVIIMAALLILTVKGLLTKTK